MRRLYEHMLAGLIFMLTFASCKDSYYIENELHGMWQVTSVENLSTGDVVEVKGRLYYSFQRTVVMLSDVDLDLPNTESYTLMAYPIDNDKYENGTPCTVRDGKLELFTTPHYYELTVQYTKGSAVYGFFVE